MGLFQCKSIYSSVTMKNSVFVVISLFLLLFPSSWTSLVSNEGKIANASTKEDSLRSPRSATGWLWNSEGSPPNEKSNPNLASNSSNIQFQDSDSSSVGPSDVILSKQVRADEKDTVEQRGYFTFVDFITSPVPPSPDTCTCVPYYLCDEGQVVTDGTGVIDLRYGWYCQSYLEVCCRKPRTTTTEATPTGSTPTPTTPPVTVIPDFTPQCGTLNPNGVNARILGFKDSETQFGEYPWMGAVLESKYIRGKWVLQFLCGASLITPRVVLTAAHCVKGKKPGTLVIRLGEWDTQTTNEFYPYQDLKVAETLINPSYYGGGLYNDIALVFLKTSAILSPNVDTICLPEIYPQYDNTSCWATGWGKTAFGKTGQYQAILKEVELGIFPRRECQAALRKTNLGARFNLHENFICAGGLKNLDTCVGDGGGPLVCPSLIDPWRYVLVGIVSWGVSCGNYGVPGVYVDVPKFRWWIDSEISKRFPYYDQDRWTISGSETKSARPQKSG